MQHTKVFITGVQRSGTTLLATLLQNHPKIYVAPRVRTYNWLSKFNSYERLLLQKPDTDKCIVLTRIFDNKNDAVLNIPKQLTKNREASAIETLNQAIDDYLTKQNKHIWLEKAPHLETQSREIAYYYPKAKIIHLVRDGRAVAASRYQRKLHDIRAVVQEWMQSCATILAHQQLIGNKNIIIINYENILLRPAQRIKKITDFLDLEYSLDLLSLKDEELQADHSYVNNYLDVNRIKSWQNVLSPKQIQQIETIAGKMLRKMGYELENPQFETQSQAMSLAKYNRVRLWNSFKLIFNKKTQGMANKKVIILKRPLRNRLADFKRQFYRFIFSKEIYRNKYQKPPKI